MSEELDIYKQQIANKQQSKTECTDIAGKKNNT